MTKVSFRTGMIAMAIGLVMVSCGGGNSNKQSGDASETKNETKVETAKGGVALVSNDFTKQIPKPDIAIKSAYSSGQNGEAYMLNLDNPTLEQVKAYAEKVKAAGFTVGASGNDMEGLYNYEARNAAGWKVLIMFSSMNKNITITKPE